MLTFAAEQDRPESGKKPGSGRIKVYVKPTAPRSIGGVLDDGLRLWRQSLPKTWQLALLAQLFIAIPLVLFRLQMRNVPIVPTPNALSAMNAANAQLMMVFFKSPAFIVGYLVVVLVTMAFYNAIVLRISAVSTNSELPVGRSLASGLQLIPRELLLLLIGFLAAVCISLAVGLIVGVLTVIGGQKGLAPVLISIVALLVIGFLMVRLFLTLIALVVDDTHAFESLKVSWALTRGNFWRCTAIVTVLVVIGVVLSLVIGLLNGLMAVTLGVNSVSGTIVSQLFSVLGNAVLGPLYPAVSLAIYCDLKLRKKGGDLAGRVNALAAQ
jgi:hypothetical protein